MEGLVSMGPTPSSFQMSAEFEDAGALLIRVLIIHQTGYMCHIVSALMQCMADLLNKTTILICSVVYVQFLTY